MIERIKVVLTTFCYVTTCVVCGTAIFMNVFYEDPQNGPEILWQIMFVSFLCSLGTCIYPDREMSGREMKVRIFIHYIMVNMIVLGCGNGYQWFRVGDVWMVIGMLVTIAVIFAIVSGVMWHQTKKEAKQLNEKLQEYQGVKASARNETEQGRAYKAVVFDMDGIIFDSERLVIETWKVIADKYGVKDIDSACLACTGLNKEATAVKMKEIYGADFPYEDYKKEASALFHERYDDGRLPMKPGVVELLTFLKEQGKRVALASSTRSETVKQELSDAGIIGFFDEIICGDMVSRSKPAPDIFLKACECLGVEPQEAYGIEDSYNGIRSAYAAGLRPIMVPDLCPPTEEMEQLTEVVLASLLEVKEYLK